MGSPAAWARSTRDDLDPPECQTEPTIAFEGVAILADEDKREHESAERDDRADVGCVRWQRVLRGEPTILHSVARGIGDMRLAEALAAEAAGVAAPACPPLLVRVVARARQRIRDAELHAAADDLGLRQLLQGRLDDALRAARESANGSPEPDGKMIEAADRLREAGNTAPAAKAFEKLISAGNTGPAARLGLARCYVALRRFKEALAMFEAVTDPQVNAGTLGWYDDQNGEIGDIPVFLQHGGSGEDFYRMIVDQFDTLYEDGRNQYRVMAIALHPYITGVPHRIGASGNFYCNSGTGLVSQYNLSGATPQILPCLVNGQAGSIVDVVEP